MTTDKGCAICKIVGVLVGVGALNWGLVGLFHIDLVARIFGSMPMIAKGVYLLIGLAGLLKLISLVKCCPCKGGSCSSK